MYYSVEFQNLWMGIKESALRTNAAGKDLTNTSAYSYRRFPIRWEDAVEPKPLKYIINKKNASGKGLDWGHLYRQGYDDCKISLTGELLDFAFMYQLCGACTTAGAYTHTYITSTTPVFPTFQMLQKVKTITSWAAAKKGFTNEVIASGQGTAAVTMTSNTTIALNAFAGYICTINSVDYTVVSNTATVGASAVVITVDRNVGAADNGKTLYMNESKYNLYIGCKITSAEFSWEEGSNSVMCTLEISVANIIAGTALATEPDFLSVIPYYFNPLTNFVWTGYTGPHTYVGYCKSWKLSYSNGQNLRRPSYLTLADMVLQANYREIYLEWEWITEELDDFDDSQRDPTTDLDQNLVHTLSNGTDSIVMTWAKMAIEFLGEAYDYNNFYLSRKYRAVLNPNQTSTMQIVETNSATNVYYEGP